MSGSCSASPRAAEAGAAPEAGAGAQAASGCGCHQGTVRFDGASRAYKTILWVIILLNAGMFLVEIVAGVAAGSMALQADSLDFAGDALTYGLSLAVIGMAPAVRTRVALVKGASLGIVAVYVLGASLWRTFVAGVPEALTMGVVGVMALAVNVASALLLLRYKDGDANVRSVWLCSRNDAIGNVAVLAAAGVVALTATRWADLAVACVMAGLFLSTSWQVVRAARRELADEAATAGHSHDHGQPHGHDHGHGHAHGPGHAHSV